MGRFQLELIYLYFPPSFHLTVGPGLGQEIEVTSTSTRPVENVITTKGLQDRNNLLLDGRTVGNKGKLIKQELDYLKMLPEYHTVFVGCTTRNEISR